MKAAVNEPLRPSGTEELARLQGITLGPTAWYMLDQGRFDEFAEVTEDRQWIHVDPGAAAASRFGGTVVHGLLTLGLGLKSTEELLDFCGFAQRVNYGYQKVRLPGPRSRSARACGCSSS